MCRVITGHISQSLPPGSYILFRILTLLLGIKCNTTENYTKDQAVIFLIANSSEQELCRKQIYQTRTRTVQLMSINHN